jgi:hypothetical protein
MLVGTVGEKRSAISKARRRIPRARQPVRAQQTVQQTNASHGSSRALRVLTGRGGVNRTAAFG